MDASDRTLKPVGRCLEDTTRNEKTMVPAVLYPVYICIEYFAGSVVGLPHVSATGSSQHPLRRRELHGPGQAPRSAILQTWQDDGLPFRIDYISRPEYSPHELKRLHANRRAAKA